MKILALCCLSLLVACDALPRDPAGSSDAIGHNGVMRVGLVRGDGDFGRAAAARLLDRLSRQTGAHPAIRPGATEPLFQALERGDLDLVLTPLDRKSPWMTRVSLSPPIATQSYKDNRLDYYAVMRNGENRWIMTVESAARAAADPGAGR
ncbi:MULTISPECIES: hypothetical protein [Sphingobium]|uniref:Lipoprotein n=2 Tax=Sphingobium cupriresistens TaxID=1132417 RepID=A0A0J7Y4D6_9SPHN|nr:MULTISPECIES: hypothetical protein [Sphingobium]KMS58724.1 hypothetical protein V473_04755 [Sphingobium cupriresistens LL01]MBJ7376509.1 hypothetical protein [Sphingobium sp.]RYM15033.1 hypothetical protein EWH12_01115 [Sphingobium cupriresistens]